MRFATNEKQNYCNRNALKGQKMTCFAVFKNDQQMRVFSFDRSYKDRERAKNLAFALAHALFTDGKPVRVEEFTSTGRIGEITLNLQKTD